MEFVWNDGGRAACGFVGMTGDCVPRAIAIATGKSYRHVYDQLGSRALKSPRTGVANDVADAYLSQLGWQFRGGSGNAFQSEHVPRGVVIVRLQDPLTRRHGHLCAVIDHVIHDTWNPFDDENYTVAGLWIPALEASGDSATTLPTCGSRRPVSREQELTQQQFDKILRRLRALDKTATNSASTEGEKRNALRMMQSLMLTHNLSREDIRDQANTDQVLFTRIACPVNSRRACQWENSLAWYVTEHVFPMVQFYRGHRGHRTMFWFYGPITDVENCLALFRELLLTIAAAAQLQYGGYARGSGASYAEGYVAGLPRGPAPDRSPSTQATAETNRALIQSRTLAIQDAAQKWLKLECNIDLVQGSRRGRYQHDPAAEHRGRQHGAQHEVQPTGRRPRITHQ